MKTVKNVRTARSAEDTYNGGEFSLDFFIDVLANARQGSMAGRRVSKKKEKKVTTLEKNGISKQTHIFWSLDKGEVC
jgi:hypothetical protein